MLAKINTLVEVLGGDGPQLDTPAEPIAALAPLTPHPVEARSEADDDASSGTATPATLETNVSEGRPVYGRGEAGIEQRQAGGWWARVRELFRRRRGEITFKLLLLVTTIALGLTIALACRAAQDLHEDQQRQQEVGARQELKNALDQCLRHLRPWKSAFDFIERGRRSIDETPGTFEGFGDPYIWDGLESLVQKAKLEEESRQVTTIVPSPAAANPTKQLQVELATPPLANTTLVNDSSINDEDLDWANPDQDEPALDLTDLLEKLDTVYKNNRPKPQNKMIIIITLSLTIGIGTALFILLLLLCRWKRGANQQTPLPEPSAPPAAESLVNPEYRDHVFEEIPL